MIHTFPNNMCMVESNTVSSHHFVNSKRFPINDAVPAAYHRARQGQGNLEKVGILKETRKGWGID